jgi:hypothetical protein
VRQAVRVKAKVWQGIVKAKAGSDWQMDGRVAKEWMLLKAGLAIRWEVWVAI